jgi:hypothetical protein
VPCRLPLYVPNAPRLRYRSLPRLLGYLPPDTLFFFLYCLRLYCCLYGFLRSRSLTLPLFLTPIALRLICSATLPCLVAVSIFVDVDSSTLLALAIHVPLHPLVS